MWLKEEIEICYPKEISCVKHRSLLRNTTIVAKPLLPENTAVEGKVGAVKHMKYCRQK